MKFIIIKIVGFFINVISYFSKSYAAEKALSLFGTPRKGNITEKQSDFLDTSFREEFEHENTTIMTYRWIGKKETILLAHGWESNSARWRQIIEHLNKNDYNLIAIDAPAHGNSGGKLFNAVVYSEFINVIAKRFQPDILIGHSVGGMASVLFQYKYQLKCINKMILLGAPSEFEDVLTRYSDMLGYNQRIRNEINHIIIERFGKEPKEFSTAKYSENINSKGLIIHDKDDTIIPFNDAILISKSFKNSKLVTTEGLDHSLNDQIVTKHIHKFIAD